MYIIVQAQREKKKKIYCAPLQIYPKYIINSHRFNLVILFFKMLTHTQVK